MCSVFDEWIRNDLGKVDVQLFAETAVVWSGGSASVCTMAPTCGRAPIVEHDGSVYSCDHYVAPEYRIGSLQTSQLCELVNGERQKAFGEDKRDRLPGKCKACRWLQVCNGGCPKDRWLKTEDGEQGLNYLCAGFQRFFSHAEQPLGQAMQMSRQGAKPAAIMAQFNTRWHDVWQGVGRNDPCPCGSGKKAKSCCWETRPKQ